MKVFTRPNKKNRRKKGRNVRIETFVHLSFGAFTSAFWHSSNKIKDKIIKYVPTAAVATTATRKTQDQRMKKKRKEKKEWKIYLRHDSAQFRDLLVKRCVSVNCENAAGQTHNAGKSAIWPEKKTSNIMNANAEQDDRETEVAEEARE